MVESTVVTDWSALRDAYGPADRVPELLAAVRSPAAGRPAWVELWSRLCHQGTVATASYAALPTLARLAVASPAAGYSEPAHLAAAIIASPDGPADPADVRRRYSADIARLHAVAQRNLPLARGATEFVCGLQALLAFEGVPVWSRRLEMITDGEAEVACPACDEQFLIDLLDPSGSPVVRPEQPTRLTDGAARAYSTALENGHDDVAATMLVLFGRVRCPSCGRDFPIPDALV